jgi:hypothetical protein
MFTHSLIWPQVIEGDVLQSLYFAQHDVALLAHRSGYTALAICASLCSLKGDADFRLIAFDNEVGKASFKQGACDISRNKPFECCASILSAFAKSYRTNTKSFFAPKWETWICVHNDDAQLVPLSLAAHDANKDAALTVDISGESRPINFLRHSSTFENRTGAFYRNGGVSSTPF